MQKGLNVTSFGKPPQERKDERLKWKDYYWVASSSRNMINPFTTKHPRASYSGTARAVGDLVVHASRLELEPGWIASTSIRLLRSSVFEFVTSPAHVETSRLLWRKKRDMFYV